jgi:predicted TIM-barrel fold metal-dependent hydrolase
MTGASPDAARPKHVVDFHTHVFPEKVAARAVASLRETYGVEPVAEATIPGLIGAMEDAGVDAAVAAPVATRPDQVSSINDWAARSGSDRIICFGALHPGIADPAAEVERMVGLGLKGVKLQPNFQEFSPDDPRMWPAYEAAQGRLVVLLHSGQEIRPFEHVHAQPAAVARVHAAFPELTMVVAHMGGYQMWDEVREHLVGEDLFLDTSYCPERDIADEDLRALIRDHGAERVVFGTDFPWAHPEPDIARLCRLGLRQEEVEAIAWENAQRLLGLEVE